MTKAIFKYSMAGGGAERVVSYLLPYLKNKGKKPASTVVANAEFAQSYVAHANTCLFKLNFSLNQYINNHQS